MSTHYEYAINFSGIRRTLANLDCADTFEAAASLANAIPGAQVERRSTIAGPWELVPDGPRIDPNTGLPCGCDDCNPDVAASDWDGYMSALRAGGLREAGAA